MLQVQNLAPCSLIAAGACTLPRARTSPAAQLFVYSVKRGQGQLCPSCCWLQGPGRWCHRCWWTCFLQGTAGPLALSDTRTPASIRQSKSGTWMERAWSGLVGCPGRFHGWFVFDTTNLYYHDSSWIPSSTTSGGVWLSTNSRISVAQPLPYYRHSPPSHCFT